jgi:glycosyltransferase involved in cell wall biosynthesis
LRIAVVGPTYPFRGGIAHFNSLMCEHLRQRHEVVTFGFRRMYPRWLFPGRSDRDPSEQPLCTPTVRSLDPISPWSWLRTAERIRALGPDVVVFHWWVTFWSLPFAIVVWRLRQCGAPVLFLCHNVLPHEPRLWDRSLARIALRQGDGYIVMASSEAAQLRAMFPSALVYQLSMPTYAGLARLGGALPMDEARHTLGLDPAKLVALFFGFVRPYKGCSSSCRRCQLCGSTLTCSW